MSSKTPIPAPATYQAFECFRLDSAVNPEYLPVRLRSHYFSEVLLVRSGACRVVSAGKVHDLAPGELIYIGPLVPHSVDSADGNPIVVDVIKHSATQLRELPSYLPDLRSMAADAARARLPQPVTAEEVRSFHLDSIISECVIECERRDFAWDLHVRALIYLLITGLARLWISKRDTLDLTPETPDPILGIPAYIEQHISESLRVEDMARRCNLSYPWFAKRFRELFGISCKQYIEHIRTQAVEQYLLYSDLELAELSDSTGYTDCSHMIKDFRRMTGMTPGQYRAARKRAELPGQSR